MFRRLLQRVSKLPYQRIGWLVAALPILYAHKSQSMNVWCQTFSQANKQQILTILSSEKEETILLVCNKEQLNKFKDMFRSVAAHAEQLGINKIRMIDQTDVRHLETFEAWAKGHDTIVKEPIDLEGKCKIYYIHPTFSSSKPFKIDSHNSLISQIKEIRSILHINPSKQNFHQSLQTFNRTTILRHCLTTQCTEDYKEQIRQLIDSELLREKKQQFSFYLTTNATEQQKLNPHLLKSTLKEDTQIFRKDVLGQESFLMSEWNKDQGSSRISNKSKLMMAIRPRVHIINKINYESSVLWYMSSIAHNHSPTLCLNNVGIRATPDDLEVLRKIREHYKDKVELAIVDTPIVSQLIRHILLPWKFTIFQLGRTVPYPKLHLNPQQDLIQQIDQFLSAPANYTPIKMHIQKQKQINANYLQTLLNQEGKSLLRVCTPTTCIHTAYQQYNLQNTMKVYRIDAQTQNVGLDVGDYWIQNGAVHHV